MCGRYALYENPIKLAEYFNAELNVDFKKSYNIAPTTRVAVLVNILGTRTIMLMRWGLIPSWHKEGNKLLLLNNAKLETIETKPSFRHAFKSNRCLILANGFYEWETMSNPKQPHYFYLPNDKPFALAGVWEKWESPNGTIDTCTIITTEANSVVKKVHDRMPIIVSDTALDSWKVQVIKMLQN